MKKWQKKYVLIRKIKKIFSLLIIFILVCILLIPSGYLLLYIFDVDYFFKSNLERKILNQTSDKCLKEEKCQLNIEDIVNFKWDELYIFQGGKGSSQSYIENVIGAKVSCYKTIDSTYGDILVFMKSGKEKYCAEIYSSYEESPKVSFLFDFNNDNLPYYFLYKNNASIGYFKEGNKVFLYSHKKYQIK